VRSPGREFVIQLTSFIKHQEVGGLFTSTTPTLFGGQSITEAHISTLTDSIICCATYSRVIPFTRSRPSSNA